MPLANCDNIGELPFSAIDNENQSQFTYQMSDMLFNTRSKASEFPNSKSRFSYEFGKSSLESGSSNEYTESDFPLSSVAKGSELYIHETDVELDSLPIDFSKLVFTTDANG